MNPMKNNILIVFCGLFLSFPFVGCSPSANKVEGKKVVEGNAPVIEVFSLTKEKLATALYLTGELIANQEVDLYAKESSFIEKLYVDVGSEVTKGQLLAKLDAPEITSRLAAAESRTKSQEAIYIASKANYDRLLETSKTPGTISQNDLDQALARKNSDLALVEAAKAAYKEVAVINNYLDIRAPFSGVITARNVNTGAYVGPTGKGSEFPIFTLQEQRHLRLVVSVPEVSTGYLSPADEVSFTVKALFNETFKAKVKRMAGALDDRLRAERVEMDVDNVNNKLLPGMVAEVIIPLSGKQETFVVPKSAIVNSSERVFVIKVIEGKAKWISVKKGRETDDQAEIYGELAVGDQLVITPTEEIREGTDIKEVKLTAL